MSRSPCASDYILCSNFLIWTQKYITSIFLMWWFLSLISSLISSTVVSDVYCLIWRILCLIFITPQYNVTVPLMQHRFIKNCPYYGFSYYYVAWILSMNLSPDLKLWRTIVLFSWILFLLFCVCVCWCINSQHILCFVGRIIS